MRFFSNSLKLKKPNPRNSAEPQSASWDPTWQSTVEDSRQLPDPPPQFAKPESPIKELPIKKTTGPVMIGGKTIFKILTGRKLRAISARAQTAEVPRR